jgi:hypothetical protein
MNLLFLKNSNKWFSVPYGILKVYFPNFKLIKRDNRNYVVAKLNGKEQESEVTKHLDVLERYELIRNKYK